MTEMVTRSMPAQPLQRAFAIAATVLAAALSVYLLLPILTPVHVEGFTGSIASLAQHLRQDSLDNFDRHQPIYTEFFGLSKLGWILLTAAVSSLFHISTTAAMVLIVWIAAPAFAAGTAFLVQRWTGAPLLLIAFILILFPAVSESAFFFNDNLPASALAVGGMCALYMRRQLAGAALCGALFGAAVLTRTDTALVGAVVPIIILERPGSVRSRFLALAMAGAAGATVFLGTLALFHSTPFDILNVAGAMIKAWNRPTITERVILLTIYFLGPAGYVLTLGGFIPLMRRRDLWCAARLLLTPAAYFLVLWAQLWEIRQLLPLTPFLASLAALALRELIAQPRTRAATVMQGGLIALLLLSLFGPITRPVFKDGPRVLFGRRQHRRLARMAGERRRRSAADKNPRRRPRRRHAHGPRRWLDRGPLRPSRLPGRRLSRRADAKRCLRQPGRALHGARPPNLPGALERHRRAAANMGRALHRRGPAKRRAVR